MNSNTFALPIPPAPEPPSAGDHVSPPAKFDRAALGYKKTAFRTIWARLRLFLNVLYCRILDLKKPLIVVFTTNMNCNWECGYCYGDYPQKSPKENMSTEEMVKLIDDLAEMGCVYACTHGGEALLRPDIGYLIDYMKLKGLYVCLVTNGQLFPKRIDDLRNVDNLTISLDGRPENNDKNRGVGTHEMAIRAIRLAVREGFKLRVQCTLSRHNVGDIGYMANLAREIGFPVMFSILYRTDFSRPNQPLALSPDQIREALATIAEWKRRGYPLFTSDENLEYARRWPYESFDKPFLSADQLPQNLKKITCHYGKLNFHIEGDGRVSPCTPLASNGFAAKNLREVGTRQAIQHAGDTNRCIACPFLTQNDWNLFMDMRPREIFHLAVEQIKELTRWF